MESKTYNLNTKRISVSKISGISNEYSVLVKVNFFVCCGEVCIEGAGEVLEAGVCSKRFENQKIGFFVKNGSIVSEVMEIHANFCWISYEPLEFKYDGMVALMVKEYLFGEKCRNLIHISENNNIFQLVEELVKAKVKAQDCSDWIINKETTVLIGYISTSVIDLSLLSNAKEMVIYDSTCSLPNLNPHNLIKKNGILKGLNFYSWFENLSFFTRKVYMNTAQQTLYSDLQFPYTSIPSKLFFPNSDKNTSNFTLDSIDFKRCFSSSLTSLDEIIDIKYLESPVSKIIPHGLFSPEDQRHKTNFSLLSYESTTLSNQSIEDFPLLEYLQGVLETYKDPEVFAVLSQLPQLESAVLGDIYLKMLPDQSIYEGELDAEKQPNGFGSRYYIEGSVFRGNWEQGKAEGLGQMVTSEGFVYHGYWSDGNYSGYGSLRYPNGDYLEGFFDQGKINGIGIEVLKNKEKFHGNFKNGLRHGNGKTTYPNNIVFLGKFKKGVAKGSGKVFYHNKVFIGEFKGDVAYGVMEYHNGSAFHGGLFKLKENGKGIFEDTHGRKICYAEQGSFTMGYEEN